MRTGLSETSFFPCTTLSFQSYASQSPLHYPVGSSQFPVLLTLPSPPYSPPQSCLHFPVLLLLPSPPCTTQSTVGCFPVLLTLASPPYPYSTVEHCHISSVVFVLFWKRRSLSGFQNMSAEELVRSRRRSLSGAKIMAPYQRSNR